MDLKDIAVFIRMDDLIQDEVNKRIDKRIKGATAKRSRDIKVLGKP
jgi:hypothetical protein